MTAVILATGRNASYEGLQETLPVPLLPLGERPFLQHIVEQLAGQGVRRFEFVLSHLPEKIESALGDGARWGCSFRFHLVSEESDGLRFAQNLIAAAGQPVLLGTAECLPEFKLADLQPSALIDRNGRWTGWGLFAPADILLPNYGTPSRIESGRYLSVETGEDFLRSQQELLQQSFQGLMIYGKQVDPGIWISRNVALHPTAQIIPPIYIGENSRIGRGARLGPFAVIGANCIVSEHAIVINSLVAAGTYVGEGLELDSVIVDRNRLLNVRLQTSILTSEAFLLGSLTERAPGHGMSRLVSVLISFILLVLLWPVLLLTVLITCLTRRGSFVAQQTVQLPADTDPANWRGSRTLRLQVPGAPGRMANFLYHFVPGLIAVLSGNLFLVGVQPRTREQVLALPSDWRALYLKSKAGLITEAAVMFGLAPTEDETYTAEAFYSATQSFRHDCRLFGLWFLRLFTGSDKSSLDLIEDPDQ